MASSVDGCSVFMMVEFLGLFDSEWRTGKGHFLRHLNRFIPSIIHLFRKIKPHLCHSARDEAYGCLIIDARNRPMDRPTGWNIDHCISPWCARQSGANWKISRLRPSHRFPCFPVGSFFSRISSSLSEKLLSIKYLSMGFRTKIDTNKAKWWKNLKNMGFLLQIFQLNHHPDDCGMFI